MAKNRLNGLDITCKNPGHNDEHRDRRHEASHDTCNPHSEMRHREQWAQFEMKEEDTPEEGVWQREPGAQNYSFHDIGYFYDENGAFAGSGTVTANVHLTSANSFRV